MTGTQNHVGLLIHFDRQPIKRIAIILACVTLLFTLIVEIPDNRCRAQEVVEKGDELIVNSGLEGEYRQHATYAHPPQWGGNIFGQAKGRYVEETHNPHSGRSALKIECDALPMGGISFYQANRVIRYAPGRTYKLSAWIRSDTDTEEVYMSIRDCEQLTKRIKATRGWRKYTIEKTFTGASGEDFVALYYFDKRPGNVVFDDITLRVVEDELAASSMSRNLLPNAGFTVSKSGFAPDWWNWYGGTERDDWPECWQPVDDHHIEGTRSIRLINSARLQTSYLRRMKLIKGTPFTLSAYLRSAEPGTRVQMHLGGWTGVNKETEVTVGPQWQRYYVTGTPEKDIAKPFMYIRLEDAGPLWVNAPQLEQGDVPTQWRLSEKDLKQTHSDSGNTSREKLPIPRIECPVVEKGPVIDGSIDDGAWEQAAAMGTFRILTHTEEGSELGEDAQPVTDARICRDDNNLYIAFRCREQMMSKLIANERQSDDYAILADDCVEVFLSGKVDGTDYLHLAVNVRGSRYDARGYERTFDTEWDCKTRINNGAWSVEFAIPFDSIGVEPGDPLRINLARYRAQRNGMEQYSSLAPVDDSFHDAERFCFLGAGEEDFTESSPIAGLEGELVAYLDRSFYTTEANASIFINAPEGTIVGLKMKDSQRAEALDATRLITINLSSLAIGKHPIQVTVGEWHIELVLKKLAPTHNEVKIDRINRILLIEDKPFVPFGMLGDISESNWKAWRKHKRGKLPRTPSLQLQADMGFNCAVYMLHQPSMTEETEEKLRIVLDAAEAMGIKIIVYYKSYDYHEDRAKWDAELLDVVAKFNEHPAILAWLVYDEPLITKVKWLEGLCDRVREADPYHPVFINWCDRGHGWTKEMTKVTGDMCLLDGYYINCFEATPSEAFQIIGDHCREMTSEAQREGKLVGYWNGLHGWATAIREHSPAEQRFVTYVALIGGAKVFLYFGGPYSMNMELRDSLKPLAREIATLAPVVACPEVKERVICDNTRIDYTAYQAEDGIYLLALNSGDKPEKAMFRIDPDGPNVEVLFEGRRITISDGQWHDHFDPLQPHVYRIAENTNDQP